MLGKSKPPVITMDDLEEFHQMACVWFEARLRLMSLESQGRFCPTEALKQAEAQIGETEKLYENTKIYKMAKSSGVHPSELRIRVSDQTQSRLSTPCRR